jgi:hypothetical protein
MAPPIPPGRNGIDGHAKPRSPQHREVVKELAGELARWGKQMGDALALELGGSV